MVDKLAEFIEDSRKMIGEDVKDMPPANLNTNLFNIVNFVDAQGDKNPLYRDPAYATEFTRYGCPLAPPMYLAAVRRPVAYGAYAKKDYGVADLFSGAEFEWFDVIRIIYNFQAELWLTAVAERRGGGGRSEAVLTAEGNYWNQYGELIGKCCSTMAMVPFKRGEEMLTDREIYVYSNEDVARLREGIEGEVLRGYQIRFWEDVKVGETLTPVVKGPLTMSPDLLSWRRATYPKSKANYALDRMYHFVKETPGFRRTHPMTNWPYFSSDLEYEDLAVCHLRGMPLPFDFPVQRVALAQHLLTNWMSDEGFLRRLKIDTPKPFLYGDAIWFNGQVTKKYKVKEKGVDYSAVDVEIEGINQLGEETTTGDATIYLPSPGYEVTLPIPC